jgi:predicted alpha-1,6-mannanase (GH76 family)
VLTLLELYIQLAAGLANRVPSQKSTYLGYATALWDWFFSIGVVNADNFIVDGVDGNTCKSTGSTYTYNQGVILGAAAELYEATGNGTYLDLASKIADAVTTKGSQFLNPNGILMDGCDKTASCSGNGEEFKGPFVRNLRKLYRWVVSPTWRDFLETNAQSIWNNALNDTNSQCFVGDYWAGPYKTADAISNGIALDALNAALYATS